MRRREEDAKKHRDMFRKAKKLKSTEEVPLIGE